MAGSEHSTSKTPGLAERPVSGNLDDRNGSIQAAQLRFNLTSPEDSPCMSTRICLGNRDFYTYPADVYKNRHFLYT